MKDSISKELISELVFDLATYLLGLQLAKLHELPTEHQRVEARRADVVMAATTTTDEHFILHLELQNQHDPNLPLRMLRYLTDIAQAHPGLPVRQYVIYTGREKCYLRTGFTAPGLDYRFTLIDMHQLDCERFMAADTPDALVMAILCDFQGQNEHEVTRRIMGRIIALTGNDENRLRKYLLMLETLAENRHLEHLVQQLELQMLTEMTYEKLPSYHLGMAKGIEKGIEKGMEKGMENGMKKGMEKGIEVGIEKGLEQGLEQGLEAGVAKGIELVAARALRQGKSLAEVAELTGLEEARLRVLDAAS